MTTITTEAAPVQNRKILPPGSTLGVFGGGQLGRMFAVTAARMGYRVHVFAPEADCPANEVAAEHTCAAYEDVDAVRRFAQQVDAITIEFENVPIQAVEIAAETVPVRPQATLLRIGSNRLAEKGFLKEIGVAVGAYEAAASAQELVDAIDQLGGGVVVKTAAFGYDGKGQARMDSTSDANLTWEQLGSPDAVIVEALVDFSYECSMLVARSADGTTVCEGPFYNDHKNHVLDLTTWRAEDSSSTAREAQGICRQIADALQLDGMICVEFFATENGLLVNEIAPRAHNSGHLTMEACSISQFEQQVRLLAGYPPIASKPRARAAAMANLMGDLWSGGEPHWEALLADPSVILHLYGKRNPLPGRKMGHLTVLDESPLFAQQRLCDLRDRLSSNGFAVKP